MNGKFLLYGIVVVLLSTGVTWSRFLGTIANEFSGGSTSGSGWHSSGSGIGGGGHK